MITLTTLLQALAALAATLGLMVIALWLWQKFGKALTPTLPQPHSIKILNQTRLTPTTTLHLIESHNHQHLIATTAAQTTLIQTYPPAAKPKKNAKLKS